MISNDETELEELSEPEFSHRADWARISTNQIPAGTEQIQIQKQISGAGLYPFFILALCIKSHILWKKIHCNV